MTRVVLVDDQEMIRSGLAMVINSEQDLEVVGQASTPSDAIAVTLNVAPDVVVMDVQLGADVTGVDAAAEILADPNFGGSILILTTFDDDAAVTQAFKVGVSGFLLKQSDSEDLLAAIRTVGAGGVAVDQAIVRRLMSAYPDIVRPGTATRTATPTATQPPTATNIAAEPTPRPAPTSCRAARTARRPLSRVRHASSGTGRCSTLAPAPPLSAQGKADARMLSTLTGAVLATLAMALPA